MNRKLQNLDGRHKLAILGALVAWGVSVWFSKQGFSIDAPNSSWLGWILAGIVTIVELVFNSRTQKLSLTLIVVGVMCYGYGVYTNITGFWIYQNPGIQFTFGEHSILSMFVGAILEVLPEPLFMWGIGSELEGDLLGNLAGLWSGDLNYAKPGTRPENSVTYPPLGFVNKDTVSTQSTHNGYKHTSFGKPKQTNPARKVVSNMFLDKHTDKFRK